MNKFEFVMQRREEMLAGLALGLATEAHRDAFELVRIVGPVNINSVEKEILNDLEKHNLIFKDSMGYRLTSLAAKIIDGLENIAEELWEDPGTNHSKIGEKGGVFFPAMKQPVEEPEQEIEFPSFEEMQYEMNRKRVPIF